RRGSERHRPPMAQPRHASSAERMRWQLPPGSRAMPIETSCGTISSSNLAGVTPNLFRAKSSSVSAQSDVDLAARKRYSIHLLNHLIPQRWFSAGQQALVETIDGLANLVRLMKPVQSLASAS